MLLAQRKALETIPLETLEQFDDGRLNPANINTTGVMSCEDLLALIFVLQT